MRQDAVDRLLDQWARERPDLDASPMGVIGRIHRVAPLLDQELRQVFEEAGLGAGEFDVLASLRRAGAPYRLAATELSRAMMVTSGAGTKRVDRLVRAGLVRRGVVEGDGRGRVVELTAAGRELIDDLVQRHLANEDRLLAPLTKDERAQLAGLLRKILVELE